MKRFPLSTLCFLAGVWLAACAPRDQLAAHSRSQAVTPAAHAAISASLNPTEIPPEGRVPVSPDSGPASAVVPNRSPRTFEAAGPAPDLTPGMPPKGALAPEDLAHTPTISLALAKWIEVDLSEQALKAHAGDAFARVFRVSTGNAEHPTIIGHYNIYVKYERIDLIGRDFYRHAVPYVMMFYPSFALHAATWHDQFGTPVSHGCVNLRLADAAWLFEWAEVGTLVFIHY